MKIENGEREVESVKCKVESDFTRILTVLAILFVFSVAAYANGPKVTFVELGSVNCIPCKAMKKIMDSLEVKYPKDLKIVFHDVWTDEGKPAAAEFGIRSIPTQVFLDANGVEYFRHEGYFPMVELEKILKQKQVAR